MKKVSLSYLLNNRKRIKIRTVISCILAGLLILQLITYGGPRTGMAAEPGETETNPYIIKEDGFIWYDNGDSYYVRKSGNDCMVRNIEVDDVSTYIIDTTDSYPSSNCYNISTNGRNDGDYNNFSNDLAHKYVVIAPNVVVTMWGGTHQFAGLTILKDAVVTHAPLVFFSQTDVTINYDNTDSSSGVVYKPNTTAAFDGAASVDANARKSAVYTPGYKISSSKEQDFVLQTGSLQSLGLLKKVDFTTSDFTRIIDGKIDVTGRGYPGGEGREGTDLRDGKIVSHVRIDDNNDPSDSPIGLPEHFGGFAGQIYGNNNCSSLLDIKALGGGGNGYANLGGGFFSTDAILNTDCTTNPAPNSDPLQEPSALPSSLNYSNSNPAQSHKPYRTSTYNLTHGPGGGGSGRYKKGTNGEKAMYRGGSGGGYININSTGDIELSTNAIIRANGQRGINVPTDDTGASRGAGGGAGGVIKVVASGAIKVASDINVDLGASTSLNDDNYYNTMVKGGSYRGGTESGSGVVLFNDNITEHKTDPIPGFLSPTAEKSNFSSAGGWGNIARQDGDTINSSSFDTTGPGGGGGGGGLIQIDGSFDNLCSFRNPEDASIPAYCEGRDVVIDGQYGLASVDAGAVPILQSGVIGQACSNTDSGNPSCDSKRHFKTLTIVNNAILTHNPVLSTEMAATGTDRSIADDTTGTARWKKVDLKIDGDLILDTGGSIDVSGRGYPGAYFDAGACSNNATNYTNFRAYKNYTFGSNKAYGWGWGPGGGGSYTGEEKKSGGGGGFAGAGRVAASYNAQIGIIPDTGDKHGGETYSYPTTQGFYELGSGGGAVAYGNACYDGGDGGGRIILDVDNIQINSIDSKIIADGESSYRLGSSPDPSGYDILGGGGSGGLIYVKLGGTIKYGATSSGNYFSPVYHGGSLNGGVGLVSLPGYIVNANNFSVKGGDFFGDANWVCPNHYFYCTDGYGGGGGGYIIIGNQETAVTIRKTLEPIDRKGSANFNPYALQIGDKIKVSLIISNQTSFFTITDKILQIPATTITHKCVPVAGTISDSGQYPGTGGDTVEWASTTTNSVSYECTVTKQ